MTASEELGAKVAASDPDRFAASQSAPPDLRAKLWVLYAFNLEIARAPYVSEQPLIAEMRLQFWADVLQDVAQGTAPRAHEVAQPLARLWADHNLPPPLGQQMIAARQWHIYRDPFPDLGAYLDHIDQSAGNLMWLAACVLGAHAGAEPAIRAMGRASGIAQWLQAVPALQAAGRPALPEGADIGLLAKAGQDALATARAARASVPGRCAPALLAGWQAGVILSQARATPDRVSEGTLGTSEFRRRGTLLLRGLSQRW